MGTISRGTRKTVGTLVALVLAAATQGSHAAPDIHIGSMHDYVEPARNTAVKHVRNNGDSTAYVRVDVVETDVAGSVLAVPTPVGAPSDGLLASPSRLIIPAGGSQSVRLITLGERDRERYYRVRFVPVAPLAEHGFAPPADEGSPGAHAATAITVLVGYGARVVAAPRDARIDTRMDESSAATTVTNAGSTTIFLHDHYVCDTASKSCATPVTERLAPAAALSLATGGTQYHRFTLQEGGEKRKVELGRSTN
jgi:hypothetical protein